ncbi:MAG TPA: hypothetical protein VH413_11555 [Verrucomicrobiae bacterium]|jgi:hypothetical protein|nr:hypothetical protein [Verrucomicrobiae bacterium]
MVDRIKKYLYDHKIKAKDCQAIMGGQRNAGGWEAGRHKLQRKFWTKIAQFPGWNSKYERREWCLREHADMVLY